MHKDVLFETKFEQSILKIDGLEIIFIATVNIYALNIVQT